MYNAFKKPIHLLSLSFSQGLTYLPKNMYSLFQIIKSRAAIVAIGHVPERRLKFITCEIRLCWSKFLLKFIWALCNLRKRRYINGIIIIIIIIIINTCPSHNTSLVIHAQLYNQTVQSVHMCLCQTLRIIIIIKTFVKHLVQTPLSA